MPQSPQVVGFAATVFIRNWSRRTKEIQVHRETWSARSGSAGAGGLAPGVRSGPAGNGEKSFRLDSRLSFEEADEAQLDV